MAVGLNGQVLGTVGVEFEGEAIARENITGGLAARINARFQKHGPVLTVGRDASVEFRAEHLRFAGNPLVNTHSKIARKISGFGRDSGYQKVMGYEIITSPLEISLLEPVVYEVTNGLLSMGDFGTKRASTHFHVGYPHNFRMLKNFLRMSLSLDPVLFRLGGMGGTFRGDSNQACYARPLMNSAAVPVKSGSRFSEAEALERARRAMRNRIRMDDPSLLPPEEDENPEPEIPGMKYVQVINPLAALEAETLEEFWASFGVQLSNPAAAKYHPMRYSGINFFAMPAHGTVEFRHANYTRNPALIVAMAKFLRASTEVAALMTKSEVFKFDVINPNEEVSTSDGIQVLSMILEMAREKEVDDLPDDAEMGLLFDTLEISSFVPLPETPVKTHIRDYAISPSLATLGKLVTVKKPLEPNQVDIHTINTYSIFS